MIMVADNNQNISDKKYIENKIYSWLNSPERNAQVTGERYYQGDHDILHSKRMVLGEKGEREPITNLPDNRKVDNQYAKMVDQKRSYLLGQPIAYDCKDQSYIDSLKKVFNKRFHKTLKDICEDCLNGGIAWIYPYYSDNELKFRKFPAYEILPFWKDNAHTELAMAVRYFEEEKPNASSPKDTVKKVEIYTKNGIEHYTYENNRLIPDTKKPHENYLTVIEGETARGYNWERIPLIPFKYNAKEIPLIARCKNLQDAINDIISTFKNNMEEDPRNTILILENYDGQNLGEFRHNLAQYGAIKVRSENGARGDVRTLNVEVNYNNYEAILKIFKRALLENCKGYDFTELRAAGGAPNQMNIKSVYSDIDLDANDMEAEFNCSLEELLWFVNKHIVNTGGQDYSNTEIDFIFNRDTITNEVELVNMLVSAGVRIPNKVLLDQVPFLDDTAEALELLKKEEEEAREVEMKALYGEAVPVNGDKPKEKSGLNNEGQ